MKSFEYTRPADVSSAIQEFGRVSNTKYLGGGTNLVDLMKYEVESPNRLIDVTRLPFDRIEQVSGGGLRIAASDRKSVV